MAEYDVSMSTNLNIDFSATGTAAILQNVAMVFSDEGQVKRLENALTEAEVLDIFTS